MFVEHTACLGVTPPALFPHLLTMTNSGYYWTHTRAIPSAIALLHMHHAHHVVVHYSQVRAYYSGIMLAAGVSLLCRRLC